MVVGSMDYNITFISGKCTGCEECSNACTSGALNHIDGLLFWDKNKCVKCTKCIEVCTNNAMRVCHAK